MPTTATPNIMVDAGYLFWAPLGTAIPVNTVVGSKFTDAWASPWVSLGATEEGSTFQYEINVEAVSVAEFFDPISYFTTERSGQFAFSLASWTLTNVQRAFNTTSGLAVVSGTGATQLNRLRPPTPGTEIRAMLGWESLDSTARLICYQTLNSGTIEMAFKKAPDKTVIPCEFKFEKPTSTEPFEFYTAGTARA